MMAVQGSTTYPTPSELGWAGGFIDGEGCVDLTTKGYPRLRASQNKITPLIKLQRLFGGGIYDDRGAHSWEITGQPAIEAMGLLHPYVVCKYDQMGILLGNDGKCGNGTFNRRVRIILSEMKR